MIAPTAKIVGWAKRSVPTTLSHAVEKMVGTALTRLSPRYGIARMPTERLTP
jgi:hypothetical protein